MLSKERSQEIINKLVASSKNYATVSISNNDSRLTRFANSEIHQNVEITRDMAFLSVSNGKRQASCSTDVFTDEALAQLARDADAILEVTPEGELPLFPPPKEDIPPAYNDPRLAETYNIAGRASAVKACIDKLDRDFTGSGIISLNREMGAFGNSGGVFHYFAADSCSFQAVVTHKDRATGYGGSHAARLEDFDVSGAFARAYDKAQKGVNPKLADVGAYTVILEPEAVEDIMFYALWGLNGDFTGSGASYASDKLQKKVFGGNITVVDDVNQEGTIPLTFDSEGYRRQPLALIENGVIKNFVHDSKTAHKAGAKPTGHALSVYGSGGFPLNVVMSGGNSSVEEMIKTTERGILVTHFHYTNFVNPKTLQVTGLTRDGTFMIENGKISYPIMNMRFTENLIEAFNSVTAISAERERVGQYGISLFPAVKIENFHFTSGQK